MILNPVANQFGSATVTLSVSDGSLSRSTSFTLTVSPQNDRPINAVYGQGLCGKYSPIPYAGPILQNLGMHRVMK